MCLDWHAGAGQALRVSQAFLQEKVQRSDGDEGRGQALERLRLCGREVAKSLSRVLGRATHGRPAEEVGFAHPAEGTCGRVVDRRRLRCGAGVEHRVKKELRLDGWAVQVARHLGGCRSKASACALAGDRDTRGVDSEHPRLSGHPCECRVAILDRAGERGLGREAVLHGHDDRALLFGQFRAGRRHHVGCACNEAAAVAVEDRRNRACRRCGAVNQNPHVRRAVHAGTWRASNGASLGG